MIPPVDIYSPQEVLTLEGKFDVKLDGQTVGIVELKREGLYCRLSCHCRMIDREIHRLYADDEKIGVLVPDKGELILQARVAAKRLKPGCKFTLEGRGRIFIPIRPGEDFSHLDKLRTGRLAFRDGEPGLLMR